MLVLCSERNKGGKKNTVLCGTSSIAIAMIMYINVAISHGYGGIRPFDPAVRKRRLFYFPTYFSRQQKLDSFSELDPHARDNVSSRDVVLVST